MSSFFDNKLVRQAFSYGLIGVLCSFIDVVVFSLLVYAVHIDDLIANIFSVVIGLTISFICNRKLTFKVTNHIALRYVSFFCVGMLGLLLSEFILYVFGEFGMAAIFSKLISVVVVGAFQFICNKLVSFKTRHESEM